MIAFQILLLLMISFDARLLRRRNGELFQSFFGVSRWFGILFLVFLAIIFVVAEDAERLASIANFLVLLPLYLSRRQRFLKKLEGAADERFWLTADCSGVILYWIFGGIVIATCIAAFFTFALDFESEMGEMLLTAMGSSVLLVYLVAQASKRFSAKGFLENVGLVGRGQSLARLLFLPGASGILFAVLSSMLISMRVTEIDTPLSQIINDTQSVDILMLFLGMALLAAPLVEEIVFRGYFFPVLRQLWGLPVALVVISVTFAGLHVGQYWGDWMAIAVITVLGFCLTGLRAWTGSTVPSSVMHYLYNTGVTLIPIVVMFASHPTYFKYQMQYTQLSTGERIALLQEAIREDEHLADVYYELAHLSLEEAARPEAALAAIEKALEYYPDERQFLETKAVILERLKRFPEALEIRKQLLEEGGA